MEVDNFFYCISYIRNKFIFIYNSIVTSKMRTISNTLLQIGAGTSYVALEGLQHIYNLRKACYLDLMAQYD